MDGPPSATPCFSTLGEAGIRTCDVEKGPRPDDLALWDRGAIHMLHPDLTQFALMLIVCFLVFVTSPFALPPSWHDITIVTSRSLSPTLCVPAPPIHLASTSLPLLFSTLPPTMSGTSSETTVDGFPKKTSSWMCFQDLQGPLSLQLHVCSLTQPQNHHSNTQLLLGLPAQPLSHTGRATLANFNRKN